MWTHQNVSGSHSDVQSCLGRNSNGYLVENVPYINFASTREQADYIYQAECCLGEL